MKLDLFLCEEHTHGLQRKFGTYPVTVRKMPAPRSTDYCYERSCTRMRIHAEYAVIFDTEKVSDE